MPNTQSAFIFDVDGVVLGGSEAVKKIVFEEYIRIHGWELLNDFWFHNSISSDQLYNQGQTTRERLQPFIDIDRANRQPIVDAFIRSFEGAREGLYNSQCRWKLSLYNDAVRLITSLTSHGTQIGLFTDSLLSYTQAAFREFEFLRNHFDLTSWMGNVITQNDVPDKRKPHPLGLQILMERLWVVPKYTTYVDDGLKGIQSAVSALVNRIFWLDREGKNPKEMDKALQLLINTGRVVRARTLDVLSQPKTPYLVILRGRQGSWKSTLLSCIWGPITSKDWLAEEKNWNWKTDSEYSNRDALYQHFTDAAIRVLDAYGWACLDAPFTTEEDIAKMIENVRTIYPHIPVIVATVTAPRDHIQSRVLSRRDGILIGYEREPAWDEYDTRFIDVPSIENLPSGVQILQLNNPNWTEFAEVLKPLHDILKLPAAA